MAADHEQHDEMSDAQIEHLLKMAYDAPEPEQAFVDTLSAKLDQEFSRQGEDGARLGLGPLSNGVAHAVEAKTDADSSLKTASPKVMKPGRSWGRWVITLVVAASLLIAVSISGSPEAYGWASMLKALEQCNWVKTVSDSGNISGWASASRGVVAARASNRVVHRHDGQSLAADYRADEDAIYLKSLDSKQATSWETRLLVLLLSDAGDIEAVLNSASSGWELVSESWKEVEDVEGHDRLIALRVKLQSLDAEKTTVEIEFLLVPETQLPISGRVLGDTTEESGFEFAYPEQGPATIFALGVPKETRLVTSLASAGEVSTSDAGQELAALEEELTAIEKEAPQELVQNVEPVEEIAALDLKSSPHQFSDWEVPETPFAEEKLIKQLDEMLATYWESQGVHRAEAASDEEFMRRVYLDLAGRIPMVSEVYQFLEDASPDRRARLVDDLLAGYDYATHMAAVWRTMLLPDGADLQTLGGSAKFDAWLAEQFAENLSYDQQVSRLLSAEGRVSESGPLLFYAALKLNPEELAAKTARVFLGSRMECAQCHDHPFDDAVSQYDFWGFAAYFAQISRPKGRMEIASLVLRVKDNARGEVMLPESDEVVSPNLPGVEQDESNVLGDEVQGEDAMPRRQQLVDWLTARGNRRFAAAAVNRVWAHLFGRGLVDPVDDMRVENAPVIPEVLELLSKDFAASGYDLRRLIRALVLSEAYQLSSRAAVDEQSQTLLFARMNMKSMTADQLYDCIAVATQNEAMLAGGMADGAVDRINNSSRQAFIAQFKAPPGQRTDYHAGIPQALTLLHGQIIHGATDLASGGLLKSLAAPFFSDQQRVETLFMATLSRLPEEQELQQMLAHVRAAESKEEKMQAMGDVLWALLNSAEFTFIH